MLKYTGEERSICSWPKVPGCRFVMGILARETEVREDELDSDVKYCSSTGKMVYLYPSQGALYSQE